MNDSLAPHLGYEFFRIAEAFPARTAIVAENREVTYGELVQFALWVTSSLLQARESLKGERVLLVAENSVEYVASFYGILLAGGVCVPVSCACESSRLDFIIGLCEPVAIVTGTTPVKLRSELSDLVIRVPALDDIGEATASRVGDLPGADSFVSNGVKHDPLAVILFTSGSTGSPKGVMLSHENLISNARSIIEYLGINQDERALAILPFYHAFGNSILQSHLLAGGCLIFGGNRAFPESLLQVIATKEATSLSAVPELFHALLSRSSLGRRELPTLRYMSVAGGALAVDAAINVAERIQPKKFYVMYGQTEATARLSYLPPESLLEKRGAIGTGIPNVCLQVVDEDDQLITGPGRVGRIRAQGPNIMLGYWRDTAATEKTLRDGWLETGDLATVDEEGFIYPCGRSNDLVKISGYRVHPFELESFVQVSCQIAQARAIPFESSNTGTRLALFIEQSLEEVIDRGEVLNRCRRELPPYLVPAIVELVDRFPLSAAGKIDRVQMKQWAADRHSLIPNGPHQIPVKP